MVEQKVMPFYPFRLTPQQVEQIALRKPISLTPEQIEERSKPENRGKKRLIKLTPDQERQIASEPTLGLDPDQLAQLDSHEKRENYVYDAVKLYFGELKDGDFNFIKDLLSEKAAIAQRKKYRGTDLTRQTGEQKITHPGMRALGDRQG